MERLTRVLRRHAEDLEQGIGAPLDDQGAEMEEKLRQTIDKYRDEKSKAQEKPEGEEEKEEKDDDEEAAESLLD